MRGCRGRTAPCKASEFKQGNRTRIYLPSIVLLKYAYRICSKAAHGAMDGYTGKSRGLPPFAGGVQTVSFRGNGTLLLREILSKWVGKLGDTPSLPWWRQSPPCNLSANWIEKLRRAIDLTLYFILFPCFHLQCFAGGSLPPAPLAELSQLDRSRLRRAVVSNIKKTRIIIYRRFLSWQKKKKARQKW